jgi:hypothetical protein
MVFVMKMENVFVKKSLKVLIAHNLKKCVKIIVTSMDFVRNLVKIINVYVKKVFTEKIANIQKRNVQTNARIIPFVILLQEYVSVVMVLMEMIVMINK